MCSLRNTFSWYFPTYWCLELMRLYQITYTVKSWYLHCLLRQRHLWSVANQRWVRYFSLGFSCTSCNLLWYIISFLEDLPIKMFTYHCWYYVIINHFKLLSEFYLKLYLNMQKQLKSVVVALVLVGYKCIREAMTELSFSTVNDFVKCTIPLMKNLIDGERLGTWHCCNVAVSEFILLWLIINWTTPVVLPVFHFTSVWSWRQHSAPYGLLLTFSLKRNYFLFGKKYR